ncbi:MAG: four helix bundle protein, partial [Anaerolineales bacterium]
GRQLLRSGTSVGAHYSEANFAKSNKDFVNKIEGALQELEETAYWLALMEDAKIGKPAGLAELQRESRELIAIFVTIAKKVKSR